MASVDGVEPYSVSGTVFFDIDAEAGAKDVVVDSGPAGEEITSLSPDAMDVQARTPVALASDTAPGPFESLLFSYSPPASAFTLVELATTSEDATAAPGLAVLGTTGKWADLLAYSDSITFGTDGSADYIAVFFDGSGASGYAFDAAAVETPAAAGGAETEPNDSAATANTTGALPYMAFNAELSSDTDADWYKVTVTAADITKKFRIRTVSGNPQTDTLVEVFFIDGTTSLGGESDDLDYHEDWTTTAIPAPGDYLIKISVSSFGLVPGQTHYSAFIELVN